MKKKTCSRIEFGGCQAARNPQPLKNFYRADSMKDGHLSVCNECLKAEAKAKRKLKNPLGLKRERPKPAALEVKNCSKFSKGECASEINPQPIDNFRIQAGRTNGKSLCKYCEKKYTDEHRDDAIKRSRKWNRDNVLRRREYVQIKLYGLTAKEWDAMCLAQEGRCKICQVSKEKLKGGLVVDHCHASKKVRGLLCHTCNQALGLFKDDLKILRSAINYLEESKIDDLHKPGSV